MKFLESLHQTLLDFKYDIIFEYVGTIFALCYHICFLITFRALGVYPMFYYNIFSVSVFVLLLIFGMRKESFLIQFFFFYFEVVAHQILADYFVGGQALFHFLILMVGFMPFFCFRKSLWLGYGYSLLSAIIFTVMEVCIPLMGGVYQLTENQYLIIKSVNVICTTVIIMTSLFAMAYIVYTMRYNLQDEVRRKTDQITMIQNHIINSLASLVDNRDTDTGQHIQRTTSYVKIICKHMKEKEMYPDIITDKFIDTIRQAAPLHDIGKIVVPDEILKKPGRFTPEEFEIMKKHASEGGRIVEEVIGVSEDKYFLQIAKEVAESHHEKWDGSGYPYGLKGEDIPLSARIMAVADVFDALVSKRCYKEAMSYDEAFKIIKESEGSHFDTQIAEIFLESRDKVLKVVQRYKDD